VLVIFVLVYIVTVRINLRIQLIFLKVGVLSMDIMKKILLRCWKFRLKGRRLLVRMLLGRIRERRGLYWREFDAN
jgi:hypothetical protein